MAKPRIVFTDSIGTATLESDWLNPAYRFAGWTPTTAAQGRAAANQDTGTLAMNRTSTRYGASFAINGLSMGAAATSALDRADRLVGHLEGGGQVAVYTEDATASEYLTCGLAPGSAPQIVLADSRRLEYSLSVSLINLATSPVAMSCHYGIAPWQLPTAITGLALWLKADAITGFADAANLTAWVSSEGSAYSFAKPSYASGYPTYQTNVVNGLPVVRHVGSGAGVHKRLNYVSTNFHLTTPTLFVVMAWKTATAGIYRRGPGCRPSAGSGYGINRHTSAAEYNTALVGLSGGTSVGATGTGVTEPSAEANGVFHVAELARTSGSGWGYYTNGTQRGGYATDSALTAPVTDDPFFTCGFYDTGTSVTDGLTREDVDVAEIVLFSRALTASERSIVRAYLGEKYRITVT